MYNPRPDLVKAKLYEFFNLDQILEAVRLDIERQYAQNLEVLETLQARALNSNEEDIKTLESSISTLQQNVGKQKAVIAHLKTKQARDVIQNITYDEFRKGASGCEEELYNQLELINRSVKILDNINSRFSELFAGIDENPPKEEK